MPRVSCGRAGSTRKARQKRNTRRRDPRDHAGYGDRWFRPFAPFFCALARKFRGRASTIMYDESSVRVKVWTTVQKICERNSCSRILQKRSAICRKTGKYGEYRALGFGQFSQGTLQSPFEGIWRHQNFTQKKSKSVSKTTCRTKICLVREKKN